MFLPLFLEEEKKEGKEKSPTVQEASKREVPKPEGEEQSKKDGEATRGAEVTIEVDVEESANEGQIESNTFN